MKVIIITLFAFGVLTTQAQARWTAQAPSRFIDAAARPAYPEASSPRRVVKHRVVRREVRGHRVGHHRVARHVEHRRALVFHHEAPVVTLAKAVVSVPETALIQAELALGSILGIPEGWEDGMAMPLPVVVSHRPERMTGELRVGEHLFHFVSGGAGWSIPFGDFPVTEQDVGSWGARHAALSVNHNDCIHDPQLGRCRVGVELHANYSGRTEGCVGIDGWAQARKLIVAMIAHTGRAFLHVWPGHVSVTPDRSAGVSTVVLREPEKVVHEARRHRHRVRRHYAHYRRHRRWVRAAAA